MSDTVEVIIRYPNGADSSRLTIRNDGTGTRQLGNYECVFYARPVDNPDGGNVEIGRFPIRGFHRWLGIEALVSLALELVADAVNTRSPAAGKPVNDTVYGGFVEPDAEPLSPAHRKERMQKLVNTAQRELEAIEAEERGELVTLRVVQP